MMLSIKQFLPSECIIMSLYTYIKPWELLSISKWKCKKTEKMPLGQIEKIWEWPSSRNAQKRMRKARMCGKPMLRRSKLQLWEGGEKLVKIWNHLKLLVCSGISRLLLVSLSFMNSRAGSEKALNRLSINVDRLAQIKYMRLRLPSKGIQRWCITFETATSSSKNSTRNRLSRESIYFWMKRNWHATW